MADQKISDLAAAGALDGSELVETVQGGVNVQTTTQDIANLGGGGVSDGDKGDITVSAGGTVWSIDPDTITGTEIVDDVALGGNPTTTTQSVGNNSTRIATTAYVDDSLAVIKWKAPVRVATTTAGTLSTSFENGDTIDGVVLATGDRVLIKNQVTGSENGIYTVNASGAPTRSTDANTSAKLEGAVVKVQSGTLNAENTYQLINDGITLGTTDLLFLPLTTKNMAEPQGVLFTDDFVRANGTPGANYTVAVTTGTVNITSNKLHLVGPAAGGFGNYARYDGLVSSIRDATLEFTFTQNSAIGASSFGIFAGVQSRSGLNPIDVNVVIISTTTNNGKFDIYRNAVRYEVQSSAGTFAVANGDRIRMVINFTEFGLILCARNLTAGTQNNMTVNFTTSTAFTTANDFKYYIGSVGGTQDVEQFSITGGALKNVRYCFVGNSILQGYGSGLQADRWVSKLMKGSFNTYTPIGCQSCRTAEFIDLQPEFLAINADVYVLCELMGNDISTGVSSGTWQANYAGMVTAIKNAGKKVIHVAPVPRNTADMSGGLSYLNSTYSTDVIIDLYTPLLGSGTDINIVYGSGDGTHPGDAGHGKMASLASAAYPYFIK